MKIKILNLANEKNEVRKIKIKFLNILRSSWQKKEIKRSLKRVLYKKIHPKRLAIRQMKRN